MNDSKLIRVEIRPQIILYVLLAIGLIALASLFSEVLLMFFIAFILSSGLRPAVDTLERRGVARGIGIALILIVLLIVIATSGVLITSQLTAQLRTLLEKLPLILANFASTLSATFPELATILPLNELAGEASGFVGRLLSSSNLQEFLTNGSLVSLIARAVSAFGTVAGLLVEAFTILMVMVYMLSRREKLHMPLLSYFPPKQAERVARVTTDVERSLGSWVRGQFLLMLIIGIATYLILVIPGIFDPGYVLDEYALTIAIIAGLLELLPTVGPAITLVVAAILAIGTSGAGALIYVVISFLALQNLESVLLVPQIMKRAVGLDPIITILGIIGAFQFGGIVAAILIVPIIATLKIIASELLEQKGASAHDK